MSKKNGNSVVNLGAAGAAGAALGGSSSSMAVPFIATKVMPELKKTRNKELKLMTKKGK